MKRLLLILVSLSMICTFSSCNFTDDSFNSEESIISNDKENNENDDNIDNISNVQTIGYWEITINSTEFMDKVKNDRWEFAPAKGNEFIVINASVKNTGENENSFLPYMVIGNSEISAKLIYNENEYSPTELMGSSDGLTRKTIKPSESLTGTIVFEVPGDAAENLSDMELVFKLKDESCSFSIY